MIGNSQITIAIHGTIVLSWWFGVFPRPAWRQLLRVLDSLGVTWRDCDSIFRLFLKLKMIIEA
jgi:hypothetical protein